MSYPSKQDKGKDDKGDPEHPQQKPSNVRDDPSPGDVGGSALGSAGGGELPGDA